MNHVKTLLTTGAAMLALCGPLQAGGEGWTSDFEAAKAQAFKEGKDLLIDFTGSDWCGWCIKLNKEVFQHEEFKVGVKDKFVLVELDFPRNKTKITAEALAQNKKLAEDYAVRGYPTIMLTDAQGRPYAKTGYRAGGPQNYVTHLDELRSGRVARDEAFAAAAKVEGVEKAKALAMVLESIELPEAMVDKFYGGVAEQIKAADPNDESGYQKGLKLKERIAEFRNQVNEKARARDMDGALKLSDDILAEGGFTPVQSQQLTMTRAMILASMQRYDDALQAVDKALEVAPESKDNEGILKLRGRFEAAKAKADEMAAQQKAKEEAAAGPEAKPAPQPAE